MKLMFTGEYKKKEKLITYFIVCDWFPGCLLTEVEQWLVTWGESSVGRECW